MEEVLKYTLYYLKCVHPKNFVNFPKKTGKILMRDNGYTFNKVTNVFNTSDDDKPVYNVNERPVS